jgi:hypothetical protein
MRHASGVLGKMLGKCSGFPGPAVADELCKSVEVHSSDSGDMAQSLTVANFSAGNRSFRTGLRGHCMLRILLIGQPSSLMRGANVGHQPPRTPALRSTTKSTPTPIPLHTGNPTTRKLCRRAERMLPMESDYVGVSSSASIWAADLHRSICEWEVRPSTIALVIIAINRW